MQTKKKCGLQYQQWVARARTTIIICGRFNKKVANMINLNLMLSPNANERTQPTSNMCRFE